MDAGYMKGSEQMKLLTLILLAVAVTILLRWIFTPWFRAGYEYKGGWYK